MVASRSSLSLCLATTLSCAQIGHCEKGAPTSSKENSASLYKCWLGMFIIFAGCIHENKEDETGVFTKVSPSAWQDGGNQHGIENAPL